MGQDSRSDEAGSQGTSRRTLLKGGAVVGTALWVAPVVETFTGAGTAGASTPAGASEALAESLAPSTLAARAMAAAASRGSQECTPMWSGYTG